MKNPKVLVASPIFDGMKYCLNEFINSIKVLDYNNYDFLLVDNSKKEKLFNELKKLNGVKLIRDDTKEERNKLRLISSRNKILNYAKENLYDYVLMMDSDVIPPKNILTELLKCNKEIVSGVYFNYFKSSGKIKLLPVAWTGLTEEEFNDIKKNYALSPLIKTNKDIRRHLTPEEVESGKILEVLIPSAGCMLIKKEVFEKVNYGLLEVPNNLTTGDDIYFAFKAKEAGYNLYCNTKIKCEHRTQGKFQKDKDGNLIHPLSSEYLS